MKMRYLVCTRISWLAKMKRQHGFPDLFHFQYCRVQHSAHKLGSNSVKSFLLRIANMCLHGSCIAFLKKQFQSFKDETTWLWLVDLHIYVLPSSDLSSTLSAKSICFTTWERANRVTTCMY